MKLFSIAAVAAFIAFAGAAQAGGISVGIPGGGGISIGWDGQDVDQGVLCNINGVTLHGKNAEDCTKAGGKVTHALKSVAEKK